MFLWVKYQFQRLRTHQSATHIIKLLFDIINLYYKNEWIHSEYNFFVLIAIFKFVKLCVQKTLSRSHYQITS